jgi:hypothetical protein
MSTYKVACIFNGKHARAMHGVLRIARPSPPPLPSRPPLRQQPCDSPAGRPGRRDTTGSDETSYAGGAAAPARDHRMVRARQRQAPAPGLLIQRAAPGQNLSVCADADCSRSSPWLGVGGLVRRPGRLATPPPGAGGDRRGEVRERRSSRRAGAGRPRA